MEEIWSHEAAVGGRIVFGVVIRKIVRPLVVENVECRAEFSGGEVLVQFVEHTQDFSFAL